MIEFTLNLVDVIGKCFEETLLIMFVVFEESVQIQATDMVVRIEVVDLEGHLLKRVPFVVHKVLYFVNESFVVKTIAPVKVLDDDPCNVSFVPARQISLQFTFI